MYIKYQMKLGGDLEKHLGEIRQNNPVVNSVVMMLEALLSYQSTRSEVKKGFLNQFAFDTHFHYYEGGICVDDKRPFGNSCPQQEILTHFKARNKNLVEQKSLEEGIEGIIMSMQKIAYEAIFCSEFEPGIYYAKGYGSDWHYHEPSKQSDTRNKIKNGLKEAKRIWNKAVKKLMLRT